ncbi:hypothetical protein QMO14_27265 [Variovorax sp. CAN2819]|uniref:hypothetical protein n=1 Tax=Variovorax sp. CAN15 TaxID=3046727 RepID=UPI0026498806|nr:hypothetical protein [Variovorax sp. CAN15]MDN6887284.1 hypothetical protein [Variovorax sp. CAN15]
MVVPELKKLNDEKQRKIIEMARISTKPHPLKNPGIAFIASLTITSFLIITSFLYLTKFDPAALIPIIGTLGAFFSSFLYSIFLAIILAPEIRKFILRSQE